MAGACFSGERERFGPADHKIWATSSVSGDSVGRGESVPAGLIPPAVTAPVNELAARLGYRTVDGQWGSPGRPSDPRDPATVKGPPPSPVIRSGPVPGAGALGQWLRARLETAGEQVAGRWGPYAAPRFLIVSRTVTGGNEAQWVVDVTWSMLGSPETWQALQDGDANLHAALRRSDMRYCPAGEDSPLQAQARTGMLADLLGLTSSTPAASTRESKAELATVAAVAP